MFRKKGKTKLKDCPHCAERKRCTKKVCVVSQIGCSLFKADGGFRYYLSKL